MASHCTANQTGLDVCHAQENTAKYIRIGVDVNRHQEGLPSECCTFLLMWLHANSEECTRPAGNLSRPFKPFSLGCECNGHMQETPLQKFSWVCVPFPLAIPALWVLTACFVGHGPLCWRSLSSFFRETPGQSHFCNFSILQTTEPKSQLSAQRIGPMLCLFCSRFPGSAGTPGQQRAAGTSGSAGTAAGSGRRHQRRVRHRQRVLLQQRRLRAHLRRHVRLVLLQLPRWVQERADQLPVQWSVSTFPLQYKKSSLISIEGQYRKIGN